MSNLTALGNSVVHNSLKSVKNEDEGDYVDVCENLNHAASVARRTLRHPSPRGGVDRARGHRAIRCKEPSDQQETVPHLVSQTECSRASS